MIPHQKNPNFFPHFPPFFPWCMKKQIHVKNNALKYKNISVLLLLWKIISLLCSLFFILNMGYQKN